MIFLLKVENIYFSTLSTIFFFLTWKIHTQSNNRELSGCRHAKSIQSCLTLCDPMNCYPPGSSVHGLLQARILEWVAMLSSRGSSWPRDWTCISCGSCTAGGFFTTEPPANPRKLSSLFQIIWLNRKSGREQYGRQIGGCRVHLSPRIHREYTFRLRSACRTPAESSQKYLTSGKEYIEPCKTLYDEGTRENKQEC